MLINLYFYPIQCPAAGPGKLLFPMYFPWPTGIKNINYYLTYTQANTMRKMMKKAGKMCDAWHSETFYHSWFFLLSQIYKKLNSKQTGGK